MMKLSVLIILCSDYIIAEIQFNENATCIGKMDINKRGTCLKPENCTFVADRWTNVHQDRRASISEAFSSDGCYNSLVCCPDVSYSIKENGCWRNALTDFYCTEPERCSTNPFYLESNPSLLNSSGFCKPGRFCCFDQYNPNKCYDDGIEGICSTFENCPVLKNNLENVTEEQRPEVIALLRSQCGGTHYCCKNGIVVASYGLSICVDPVGTKGTCSTLQSCTCLQRKVQNIDSNIKEDVLDQHERTCEPGKYCCTFEYPYGTAESDETNPERELHTKQLAVSPKSSILMKPAPFAFDLRRWVLSDRSCGRPSHDDDTTEQPWLALLRSRSVKTGLTSYTSLGALITKRYVLCPAHNLVAVSIPDDVEVDQVRLGAHRSSGEFIQDIHIEERIIHHNYNHRSNNGLNDIALLRLSQDVLFSDAVQPICIPKSPPQHESVTTVSWRSQPVVKGVYSIEVLSENSNLVSASNCATIYHNLGLDASFGHICTESTNEDFCDSLLLQYQNESNRWQLVALKSSAIDVCRDLSLPSLYTNVNSYINWILSNIY